MIPIPPFAPAAVVLDLDGLLVDSETLWADAEREVVESFGRQWHPGIQRQLLGRGPLDAAGTLARLLGGPEVAEVDRRMRAASEQRFRNGTPLRPGAARLVQGLAGRLPLAVATNSRRRLAELALASTGLDGNLDAVVTADDVVNPKPAPDPYATACERLGVRPSRTVAFEDSPVGVASAAAAGLWVVGCPSFVDESLEAAHCVVASLEHVDPGALLAAA